MDGQGSGVLTVSLDLLRMIIDLPPGVEVLTVLDMDADDHLHRQCRLLIAGGYLPTVPEGADPPQIIPIHMRIESGKAFLSEFVVSGKTIYRQRIVAGEVQGEWCR